MLTIGLLPIMISSSESATITAVGKGDFGSGELSELLTDDDLRLSLLSLPASLSDCRVGDFCDTESNVFSLLTGRDGGKVCIAFTGCGGPESLFGDCFLIGLSPRSFTAGSLV